MTIHYIILDITSHFKYVHRDVPGTVDTGPHVVSSLLAMPGVVTRSYTNICKDLVQNINVCVINKHYKNKQCIEVNK